MRRKGGALPCEVRPPFFMFFAVRDTISQKELKSNR